MKKIILLLVIAALGFFVYNNFRGVRPAVMPVVGNIADSFESPAPAVNQTDFPLALPDGFTISIFARGLGSPRVLVWDPKGTLLVSIPSQGKVVALSDTQVTVASGLNRPHGLAFFGNTLYIAETNQVAMYEYDSQTKRATNKRKLVDLPNGGNHVTRSLLFDHENDSLYISIGSSCNACIEEDKRRAAILSVNSDGSNLHTVGTGLRNAVFLTQHPKTEEIWVTEMGRDLIGDDIPPDEINILKFSRDTLFYGWPYCYGKNVEDSTFRPRQSCDNAIPSHIDLQAHSAPLGLAFIPDSWSEEYHDDLLIAYHGSWNRTEPTGYKIVRAKLDAQGKFEGTEDFITGWLAEGGALGRPVDLLFGPDGSLYISDDKSGVIYRVSQT